MSKKNLNRDFVRLLRKVQKFLIAEPRRYDMKEGIAESEFITTILEQPPCGTACCFAGAVYLTGNRIIPDKSQIGWLRVYSYVKEFLDIDDSTATNLFYAQNWPEQFAVLYDNSKTAQERAYVGAARFEHFIATGE